MVVASGSVTSGALVGGTAVSYKLEATASTACNSMSMPFRITATLNGFYVFSAESDMCSDPRMSTACPMAAGPVTITGSVVIPTWCVFVACVHQCRLGAACRLVNELLTLRTALNRDVRAESLRSRL